MGALMVAPQVNRRVREVTFELDARRVPDANSVALVVDFNRWDTALHHMALGPDNVWTIVVTLAPGEHRYLFIVDGSPWNDPLDDRRVPCEWGGSIQSAWCGESVLADTRQAPRGRLGSSCWKTLLGRVRPPTRA